METPTNAKQDKFDSKGTKISAFGNINNFWVGCNFLNSAGFFSIDVNQFLLPADFMSFDQMLRRRLQQEHNNPKIWNCKNNLRRLFARYYINGNSDLWINFFIFSPQKDHTFFFKSGPLFIYFRLFNTVDSKRVNKCSI